MQTVVFPISFSLWFCFQHCWALSPEALCGPTSSEARGTQAPSKADQISSLRHTFHLIISIILLRLLSSSHTIILLLFIPFMNTLGCIS